MAALAIPIVVLGSLFILSEQEKKKRKFSRRNTRRSAKRRIFNRNK